MNERSEAYARYVLGVLVLVYVLNFLDRQIVSILAERIKADLGLTDGEIGFLYGTAFAVFYAVFGIPLGRLADVWDRRLLISIGLAFWSGMTALSGLARNFGEFAAARIGVGVGEASASPAAYSMLSDYFPASKRATVLAIYSSGIYIGAGLGLGLGGLVVDRWDAAFPGGDAPFGLRGWQVAYFVVGTPGILFALWVRRLREPVRGASDGLPAPAPHPHPFRELGRELRAVLPPFTLFQLGAEGGGAPAIARNVVAAIGIIAVATLLTLWLGTPAQWIALGLGLYAATSWAQVLRLRDPVAATLLFDTPTLRYGGIAFALLAFVGYGVGFWMPPFFIRTHSVGAGEAGFVLGGISALAGWLGTTAGGVIADRWRLATPAGRLYVAVLTGLLPIPFAIGFLSVESRTLAYGLTFPLTLFSSMWVGVGASTIQDMVLPRMRATASAAYLLLVTLIGLALGPYTIGLLSTWFGDLRQALFAGLVAGLGAAAFAALAAREIGRDQATLLERARAAGEPL
ncbi:MAG: spinster family MFS transporter [Candidatus Binatia bacterium]